MSFQAFNADFKYIDTQIKYTIRHQDGRTFVDVPPEAKRIKRWLLHAVAQNVFRPYYTEVIKQKSIDGEIRHVKVRDQEFKQSYCGQKLISGEGASCYLHGATGHISIAGIMRCGSIWTCPICSEKVMTKRREEVETLFDAHINGGGMAFMVTYTARHTLEDPLATMMQRFKTAQRYMSAYRSFKNTIKGSFEYFDNDGKLLKTNYVGRLVTTEVTYGELNGWHVHQHQCWFFDSNIKHLNEPFAESLRKRLFEIWQYVCKKHSLETEEFFTVKKGPKKGEIRPVGVDVRRAMSSSEYFAKHDIERGWSPAWEFAGTVAKKGLSTSMTPWALLELCGWDDTKAKSLFVEYARATKGIAAVSFRGCMKLIKKYGVRDDDASESDDQDDANKNESDCSILLGELTPAEHQILFRGRAVGSFIEMVNEHGFEAAKKYLQTVETPATSGARISLDSSTV